MKKRIFKITLIFTFAIITILTGVKVNSDFIGLNILMSQVEALSSGEGSNNEGSGNQYYYKHLLGRPKTCTLYKCVSITGNVEYTENSAGFGAGWTVTKTSGKEEGCPNNGNGCTVYSCRVTN